MANVPNRIISINEVSPLAEMPVTLAEAKEYMHITFSDDDATITELIETAVGQLESYTGKAFGAKTISVELTHSGYSAIRLPIGPVNEITDLQYRSCRLTTWRDVLADTDDWQLSSGGRFASAEGYYAIEYTTAWPNGLPSGILTAIKAQVLWLFENRGDSNNGAKVCDTATSLLKSYVAGDLML